MRTLHKAGAFNHRRRQHARPAEVLQTDAGPDDIDDRIDGPDFVEVDLLGGVPMDFAFGDGDAVENGNGAGLNPFGEAAGGDQAPDLGVIPALPVSMVVVGRAGFVRMGVLMAVGVLVCVGVGMGVGLGVAGFVGMGMFVFEVDVKFGTRNAGFFAAAGVEMVAGYAEAVQFGFEGTEGKAEVDQGSEEHVAAEAAEDIEIEVRHGCAVIEIGEGVVARMGLGERV